MRMLGNALIWMTQGDMFNEIINVELYCGMNSAIIGPIQTDFDQRREASLPTTVFKLLPTSYTTNLINCPVQSVTVVSDDNTLSQQDANDIITPFD